MSAKKIILLVGPKGSGKTYLASRMENELGVGFVRVEPIWLALAKEMRPGSIAFDNLGQFRVLDAVRTALTSHSAVCLESTGTAPWLPRQLKELEAICDLMLVKVEAPLSLCLERVRQRDASQHIPVSDERVAEINEIAAKVDLPWAMRVRNIDGAHAEEFLRKLSEEIRFRC